MFNWFRRSPLVPHQSNSQSVIEMPKQVSEEELFEMRKQSLQAKLSLTEPLTIFYQGPSPAFMRFFRELRSDIPLGTSEQRSSIANLAREKIERIKSHPYETHMQYTQPITLDETIKQIAQRVENERKNEAYSASLFPLIKKFQEEFPNDCSIITYRVSLMPNERRDAYNVAFGFFALNEKRVDFPRIFPDPINMDELFDAVINASGPISRELYLRSSAA